MSAMVRPANKFGKESIIPDNRKGVLGEKQPDITLLGTDAAVAYNSPLDLGGVDFKDEGTAVAIASVRLRFSGG